MNLCKQCKEIIPARLHLDNKIHILVRRKYCLKCHPFGTYNNRTPVDEGGNKPVLTCPICSKTYVLGKPKGGTTKMCSSCRTRTNIANMRTSYKKVAGEKCMKCGYNKCTQALQFHHIKPEDKSFIISYAYSRSKAKVINEINKCILICANCHAELHASLWSIDDVKERLEVTEDQI